MKMETKKQAQKTTLKLVKQQTNKKYGHIEGIVSKVNVFDDVLDIVRPGAFDSFLASEKKTKVMYNHTDLIGTADLSLEPDGSLYAVMKVNLQTQKGKEAYELAKQFYEKKQELGLSLHMDVYDYELLDEAGYEIKNASVKEVSIVPFQSNPQSIITVVKKAKDQNNKGEINMADEAKKEAKVASPETKVSVKKSESDFTTSANLAEEKKNLEAQVGKLGKSILKAANKDELEKTKGELSLVKSKLDYVGKFIEEQSKPSSVVKEVSKPVVSVEKSASDLDEKAQNEVFYETLLSVRKGATINEAFNKVASDRGLDVVSVKKSMTTHGASGTSYEDNKMIFPDGFRSGIVDKLEEISPVLNRIYKYKVKTKDLTITYEKSVGNATYTSETSGNGNTAIPAEADVDVETKKLTSYEIGIQTVWSDQLEFFAASDFMSWYKDKIVSKLQRTIEKDLFLGDGASGKAAKGLLHADNLSTYKQTTTATRGKITDAELDKLQEDVEPWEANFGAFYIMHPHTWFLIKRTKDSTGAFLYQDYTTLANGAVGRIKGKEVVLSEYMPKPSASGKKPLILYGAFGNREFLAGMLWWQTSVELFNNDYGLRQKQLKALIARTTFGFDILQPQYFAVLYNKAS